MLIGLLGFEWRYHTRRLTFAAAVLLIGGMAAAMVDTGYGGDAMHVNSPYSVMQSMGLLSLICVLVLTIFCANAMLRDVEHGMTELIFSRPIGKTRYLASRFLGVLLAGMTVMTIGAAVLMLAPLGLQVEPDRLGPARILSYVWPLLTLVLPNLIVASSLLVAVATLSRSTIATYVGGIALYALYWVTALLVSWPLMAGGAPPTAEELARAAMLDPFGLSAFFEQSRYWLPAERDVRTVELSGRYLWNRLVWLGVAGVVLALVRARFQFHVSGAPTGARARRWRWLSTAANDVTPVPVQAYRPLTPSPGGPNAFWCALQAATRLELRQLLRGWTFVTLLALWAFVAGMEAFGQLGSEYGTRVLATSGLLADALQVPLLLFGSITIVYFAAEVAWRERIVGFDPLADATPASNAVFYLAKLAALSAIPLVLGLVGIVAALGVQVLNGGMPVQPLVYLSLLWFTGVPLVLLSVGVLAVQAISSNRWLGMLGGVVLVVVSRQGAMIGLEHPMLQFTTAPSVSHSDLDGFGPAAMSFAAFMLYWSAFALLLACVSWGVWRRGLDAGARARIAAMPRVWGRAGTRVAIAAIALFVAIGGALFWQTNVVHAWESADANTAWRTDYERTYRWLAGTPQPRIVAVRIAVDMHPAKRRADVRGTLTLENRHSQPLDTLWVVLGRDAERVRMSVSDARLVRHDARFGVHVFALERPMAPAAQLELQYALTLDRAGVRAAGFEYDVAANGTYITSSDAMPSLGYRGRYELSDSVERHERDLGIATAQYAPLSAADSLATEARRAGQDPAWITLDATLSTSADQTALAPGRLVRAWTQNGRRYVRYVVDRPITPRFAVTSGRYAVRKVQHGAVRVEMWFHPEHDHNIDRMLVTATRSLDVLGARFGAYPHATLRMVEVPLWWRFGAFAAPGMLFFTEDRGMLADARAGDVNLVTRRVAHEVSHQWWGHTVDPLNVVGSLTIVESLAKYSEQLVVASMRGEGAVPPMLAFDHNRYLQGRTGERDMEPTLLATTDQSYMYYGKGAIAMHAIHDLLGDSAMTRALATLLATDGGPRGAATTPGLHALLRAAARSDADRRVVDEWFTARVVYDLGAETATTTPMGERHRLTASFRVDKRTLRGRTEEALSADGALIDIAVSAEESQGHRVLYVGEHAVVRGRIELSLTLPVRPGSVEIDPSVRRIDRDRSDNRRRVVDQ